MAQPVIYTANDNLLELTGFRDATAAAGTFLNAATVTYDVKDKDGASIDSGTLTYVVASDGNYRGTVADTVNLEDGQHVSIEVDANGGAGLRGFWEIEARALRRTE